MARWCCAALVSVGIAFGSADADPDRGTWRAEDPGTIETDRPGNGNVGSTVPAGYLNVESGALYALERSGGGSHAVSFPLALRLGVLAFLELRLANALIGIEKRDGQSAEVVPTDLMAGTKAAVLRGERLQPDVGISIDVFFPTGRGSFTYDVVVPEIRLLVSQPLPRGLGLLFNVGIDVPGMDGQRFARFVYVANVHYALPILGNRWSFFVEGFGRVALAATQQDIVQVDAGTAFLIRPSLQIDFFSQHGLSEAATDHQFSIGFSALLP